MGYTDKAPKIAEGRKEAISRHISFGSCNWFCARLFESWMARSLQGQPLSDSEVPGPAVTSLVTVWLMPLI